MKHSSSFCAMFVVAGAAIAAILPTAGSILSDTLPTAPDERALVDLRRAYDRPRADWPAPWLDADVSFVELGRLDLPHAPTEQRQRRIALGARLFHDSSLSSAGDQACSTCHDGQHGWTSATVTTPSHRVRNPPSLYSVSSRRHLGWDGRKTSLAAQSLLPLTRPDEMGNPELQAVIDRLRADPDYDVRFAEVYDQAPISISQLADSLVAFLSSLEIETRFDRYAAGERALLNDQEVWGLHLFRTKARCVNCHFGPLLTDDGFHNLRISFFGENVQDLGRFEVTQRADDVGRFRTPSLRHVAETAPYMHNGLFATLEGVINLYDRGGGEVWARNATEAAAPLYPFAAHLSPHIRPLGLSEQDKSALVAFLRTL